jgi:Ni,Fe-hydrogenase III small subunit
VFMQPSAESSAAVWPSARSMHAGGVKDFIPVDLHIRGCPPTPTALLGGLVALLEIPAPLAEATRKSPIRHGKSYTI